MNWGDVWFDGKIPEIYKDNGLPMPFVTSDVSKHPHISDWMRVMGCGCTVFHKGYALQHVVSCEKHCPDPYGWVCTHNHDKRRVMKITSPQCATAVAYSIAWEDKL